MCSRSFPQEVGSIDMTTFCLSQSILNEWLKRLPSFLKFSSTVTTDDVSPPVSPPPVEPPSKPSSVPKVYDTVRHWYGNVDILYLPVNVAYALSPLNFTRSFVLDISIHDEPSRPAVHSVTSIVVTPFASVVPDKPSQIRLPKFPTADPTSGLLLKSQFFAVT